VAINKREIGIPTITGMGCGSSQPSGAASSSAFVPSSKGGRATSAFADRLGVFSCHLHIAPPASPSAIVISGGSSTGPAQLELKQQSGSNLTTEYEADCVFDSSAAADMTSYYSKNISPIIKACCNNKEKDRSALLLTLGRQGSGKTTSLYGQLDGSGSGGIVRLVCEELLDTCDSEQMLLALSLICVPTGTVESGAYDCLTIVPSSSADTGTKPPLLASAAEAKNASEVEVKSMDDVNKVLKCGRSESEKASASAHSLLIATIRCLDGSGNVVSCNQIKILDLHGDVPGCTSSRPSSGAAGKSGANSGKGGGRGGRKGGRGWSSFDTRKGAASNANDEDLTVRTIRRVVDFLSRRFKNVPYQDSVLTTLIQSELEGAYSTEQEKSVACIVCIRGQHDEGDEDEASKWHGETQNVLEFMQKMRRITVLPPAVGA